MAFILLLLDYLIYYKRKSTFAGTRAFPTWAFPYFSRSGEMGSRGHVPIMLLLLTIASPMASTDEFLYLTRLGSAGVALTLFNPLGLTRFRECCFLPLPRLIVAIPKQYGGIHSTAAPLAFTLMAGRLFPRCSWERAFLLSVFTVVSLTKAFRVAILSLFAERIGKKIFRTSSHRERVFCSFL